MELPKPDLVIGIDFGMTCTGVAYANISMGSETIRWIQRWPGRMQANENKVPTILIYPNNHLEPSSWGFLSETMTEQTKENNETHEWFKTLLDEDLLRKWQAEAHDITPTTQKIEKWTRDYFRHLYRHIESRLKSDLTSSWDNSNIEFIFSVPTTWKPHPTVERFKSIIEQAGFGRSPNHRTIIGLTEAEAAAVFVSREAPAIFKERDILLICDAGGGTTDLSVLRVTNTAGGTLSLEQLDVVFGASQGSARIDTAFESSVKERLGMADRQEPLGIDINDTSWLMMKSREFQNAKCDYGSLDDTDFFSVTIPNLNKQYEIESLGIVNGELRYKREDLQALFDEQIIPLFELIDKQLHQIQQRLPHEQVAHLVLSGGLGNSLYVQKRLRTRYANGSSPYSNASILQVRVAPDPQLVVCKGIVADRIQKLKAGVSVLKWRCCRVSYGTTCKVPYDHKNPLHFNQTPTVDPVDGKEYVANVVNWFIKQGEPVSSDDPITCIFRQNLTRGLEAPRIFRVEIVQSHLDKSLLPYTMNSNCSVLRNMQADFSTVKLAASKPKFRRFWNPRNKYYQVDYTMRVILGPADISFELWLEGQKINNNEPVRVEWHNVKEPTTSFQRPFQNQFFA